MYKKQTFLNTTVNKTSVRYLFYTYLTDVEVNCIIIKLMIKV